MENNVIINPTTICINFPSSPQNEIHRDYVLDTIDQMLKESSLVVVGGQEGIGKTTVLTQYARRHPNDTISCYINANSKIGYDPDSIRLIIAEQVFWIITKKFYEEDSIDTFTFNRLIYRLERMAKNRGMPYVFMVDGIDDIPKEDNKYRSTILRDILPIGQQWLKCLFSGTEIAKAPEINHLCTSWMVPFLGENEVREYFHDIKLNPEQLSDIKQICKGIPSRISSVKRLLNAGKTIEEIIDGTAGGIVDFVGMEFQTTGKLPEQMSQLMALIAFSLSTFSIQDLSIMVGLDQSQVLSDINNSVLLQKDVRSGAVSFISNLHRKHAQAMLSDRRQWAIDRIIEYLGVCLSNSLKNE